MQKIMVTGSEGYIGSVLVDMLLNEGYEVTGLDTCFYSAGNLTLGQRPSYRLIKKDVRNVEVDDLAGFDAIIHLAALSNDPLGMLDESLTLDINYKGTVRLAEFAKKAGVRRFIFSSSCSLYGQGDKILTEEDSFNPQTAYGKSKILAEKGLSDIADDKFSPVYMRNATAFGISSRMRFDIVVNSLTGFAKTTGEIQILGDGTPWRPLIHIKDISSACIKILKAEREKIHNHAFNIGHSNHNYQIKTIAEKIQQQFSDCQISIAQKSAGDTRNYRVSFDKLDRQLCFRPEISLERGIGQIAKVYDKIALDSEAFEHRLYTRLKQIKWLISNGSIDKKLFWVN